MTISCNKPNLPIIKDNTITLNTEDGNSVTYKRLGVGLELPKIIAQGITKYSTDSDPNISETELGSFKQEVYENFLSIPDGKFRFYGQNGEMAGTVVKDSLLKSFERLFNCYASDKKITPDEYTKMLKIMLDSASGEKEIVSQKQEQPTNNTNTENKPTAETESQPRKKYWFGGLIDLGRAIVWSINGD